MRGFFMFKKIKKHRLSLLLLAMVAMLSVYYVLMPQDGPLAPVGGDGDTNTRYQDFAEMRLLILDERNKEVALYEAKITEATVSLNDIEEYILEIETISTLTEKEVYLESIIVGLGFTDTLCYLDEENVLNVSLLTDSFTKEEYVEIAIIAKEEFGLDTIVKLNTIKLSS